MIFPFIYCFRKTYIRLISALSILILGPWVGCQLIILLQQGSNFTKDINLMVSISLYCLVFLLSISLATYPDKQVRRDQS